MPQILCFYHAPCNDGSASAAALAHRIDPDRPADTVIEAIPTSFGRTWEEPFDSDFLDFLGHHDDEIVAIYIVDISISQQRFTQVYNHLRNIGRIGEAPPMVVCIDHHQSAIDRKDEIARYCDEVYIRIGSGLSGATLTWLYFDEKQGEPEPMPVLLRYVADQDVWDWKLDGSRAVNAALNTLSGHLPDMVEELAVAIEDPDAWRDRREMQGRSMLSVVDSQIAKSLGMTASFPLGKTARLHVVNASANSSELGNRICEEADSSPNVVAMIYALAMVRIDLIALTRRAIKKLS